MANCMFLRRRYVNEKIPTVLELFSDISVISIQGRSSSSTGKVSMNNSNIPTTETCYIFSFCYGYVGIWKFVNGVINETAIKRTVPSSVSTKYGCLYHNTTSGNNHWNYRHGDAIASGTADTGTNVNGATIVLAKFPSYSADIVDYVLSNATYERKGGQNSTSDNQANINTHNQEIYLIASNNALGVWKDEGNAEPYYSNVFYTGPTSYGGYVSQGYLRTNYTYGYSFISLNSPVT